MNLVYLFEDFDFRCRQKGCIEALRRRGVTFKNLDVGDVSVFINKHRDKVLWLFPASNGGTGILCAYHSPFGKNTVTKDVILGALRDVGADALRTPGSMRKKLGSYLLDRGYGKRAA
jgi:hypothetical protein